MKEQQPIGITELQQKIERVDGALVKANRVIQAIGTPEFGRPELDISPTSQLNGTAYLDAAVSVGKVRKALTENAIPTLTDLRDQVQIQISDSKPQKEEVEKLQQIRGLMDTGYLPPSVFEMSQEIARDQGIKDAFTDHEQFSEIISMDGEKKYNVDEKRIKYLNAVNLFARNSDTTLEEIISALPLGLDQHPASYARAFDDMSRTIFYINKGADKGNATLQELAILKTIKERIESRSQIPVDEEAISRVFSSRVAIRNWLESEIKAKGPEDTRPVTIRKVDEDVERLRKEGLNNSEIALELGTGLARIELSAHRLIAAGRIESKHLQRGVAVSKRDAQIKQLRNEGFNNKTIAQQLGVSKGTVTIVTRRLIKAGEMTAQSLIAKENRARFDTQVEELRRQGLSNNQIVEQLGRKKSSVGFSISRLIAAGRIERSGQQGVRGALEKTLDRHLSENPKKAVALTELAKEVGVNRSRAFNLYQQIAKERKVPLLRLGRSRKR